MNIKKIIEEELNKTLDEAESITTQKPVYNANNPIDLAQQIKFYVNQAVDQRFDIASERMKAVKRVGDIQAEVNMLRRDYRNEFPNRRNVPNLIKRLQAILAWIKANPDKVKKTLLAGQVPIAPEQQPTDTKIATSYAQSAASSGASVIETDKIQPALRQQLGTAWIKSGVDKEDPFTKIYKKDNKWFFQGLQPSQTAPVPENFYQALDNIAANKQESKSLRGMILKELLSVLK